MTPSYRTLLTPILGISIDPRATTASLPFGSAGGAAGVGSPAVGSSLAAAVVVGASVTTVVAAAAVVVVEPIGTGGDVDVLTVRGAVTATAVAGTVVLVLVEATVSELIALARTAGGQRRRQDDRCPGPAHAHGRHSGKVPRCCSTRPAAPVPERTHAGMPMPW